MIIVDVSMVMMIMIVDDNSGCQYGNDDNDC